MRYPVWCIAAALALVFAASAGAAGVNPQLAGLQVALARHALYSGPIDAVPGPMTRAAVVRFQAHHGLVPDGIVGPKTRAALGRLGRPLFGTRMIRPGMSGWDVAVLQYLLTRRRLLHAQPNGHFGPQTEAAVLRFQRARGLDPDGIVGPSTAARLCKLAVCEWRAASKPKPMTQASVRDLLDRWADYYGVDRHLVRGLAWQESGYQQDVVSEHGAVGVMQVMPDAWSFVELFLIGHPVAPTVEGNVRVGVAYLHYLLQYFGGDTTLAVAAYLQGPRSVKERGISGETQIYVNNVLALAQRL
jgi:transglycosylase-like protein with SLT domain/putative peptidoglycan binding protein